MQVIFQGIRAGGRIHAIPSKSEAHRALIAAALADAKTHLALAGTSDDIEATLSSLRALGADMAQDESGVSVTPIGRRRVSGIPTLEVGESGSTLRFLLPVALALYPGGVRFSMRGRLPRRPLSPLRELLEARGVIFTWENESTLLVRGALLPGDYIIPADVSSQFVSGLLFALPLLSESSTLSLVGRVESAPYIDMTRDSLAAFRVAVTPHAGEPLPRTFTVEPKIPAYEAPREALAVGGDYSNAAFFLVLGALSEIPVTVTGLEQDSRQGDRAILSILTRFGAHVSARDGAVSVAHAPLVGSTVDASQIPDLVPILSVLATQAAGVTRFIHAERLRLKESDRIASTAEMLRAVGAHVEETADGLTVTGGVPLHGGHIDAAGDHRIAMCTAILATLVSGTVTLDNAEAVTKSYPHFYRDLQALLKEGSITRSEHEKGENA